MLTNYPLQSLHFFINLMILEIFQIFILLIFNLLDFKGFPKAILLLFLKEYKLILKLF